ncbi:MAG: cytochrome c oxidase subunit II [Candidatus Nanopelagicales bacterium]
MRRSGAYLAAISALVLSACSQEARESALRMGLPAPATAEGPTVINLWQGTWLVAIAIAILVIGLLFAAIILYRRKSEDEVPKQTRYNIPMEILYTAVPLVIVFGLFFFTARDQAELTKISGEHDHTVNVVAFKWSWAFNYLDYGVYEIGTPAEPPVLYLPIDEKVKFELTSPDVIHSFWIPAFLTKMDVIPGRMNVFEVTPNKSGDYAGKCAELCGVDHSRMLFNVKVVSQEEFEAHISTLRAKGQEGKLDTGRIVTKGNTNCAVDSNLPGCKEVAS